MNSDDPQGEGGEPGSAGKVVRLPRDWLGPPEELVPIGRAADRHAGPPDDPGPAPDPDPAMDPDAFWSESSAAVHGALRAAPAGHGGSPGRRGRLGAIARGARTIAARGRLARPAWIAATGAAVLIVVALTGRPGGRTATRGAGAQAAVSGARVSRGVLPGHRGAGPRALAAGGRGPTRRRRPTRASARSAALRTRRPAVRIEHRRAPHRRRPGSTGTTVEPVRYSRPAASAPLGSPGPSTPTLSAPTPSVPAVRPPAPRRTAAGSNGAASARLGAQPTLGAAGTLGPGSSPDG